MGISALAIIFVFGVVILVHELGHFLAAKWMGVRVERFSIGFPPRLFGKKIGDTDYCISAIPVGGYVKMSGMVDESFDTKLTGAEYEFSSKPVWKRIIIIIAGVFMNFILAISVLTILNFIKGERITPYTEIGAVGTTGVTQRIGFKAGDKIVSINGVEVKSWEEINREFINNLNKNIEFIVQRDGQRVKLQYRKEWFKEKNAEYLDIAYLPSARIGKVRPDMPAGKAGMKYGDEIVQIAGEPVKNWEQMTKLIRAHPADTITISWRHQGQMLSAHIVPQKVEEKDSSTVQEVGKIGVEPYFEYHSISFPKSVMNGLGDTFDLLALNMKGLWWILTGAKPAKDLIGGPIMIAKMAGDAAKAGWEYLWTFTAGLSAILAFFNILPIPALDGGHLTFLIIEAITRKPISVKIKLMVQQIGMAILLTLIVYVIYLDIRRIFI
jgi:regulator of sigma E protease